MTVLRAGPARHWPGQCTSTGKCVFAPPYPKMQLFMLGIEPKSRHFPSAACHASTGLAKNMGGGWKMPLFLPTTSVRHWPGRTTTKAHAKVARIVMHRKVAYFRQSRHKNQCSVHLLRKTVIPFPSSDFIEPRAVALGPKTTSEGKVTVFRQRTENSYIVQHPCFMLVGGQ